MEGTPVYVTNGELEELCGTVEYTMDTAREKDVVECGDKEGDGVIIRGGRSNQACIHVLEVTVIETVRFGTFLLGGVSVFNTNFI